MRNPVDATPGDKTRTSTDSRESVGDAPIKIDHIVRKFQLGGNARTEMVALDDVSFQVNKGEFLSIIGPSGCGKTTLLRIIASLTPANSGDVYINGKAVTKPSPERAMVFQQFGLFPWKAVLDNVKFPLTLQKMPDKKATEIAREQLRRVGLKKQFEQNHPHQLSGGMQQRVGLARALATDAEILLMDEPFGAIDAQTREIMQDDLARLCAESGKTVVLVTHDIDEAVLLADRVLILSAGPGKVCDFVEVDLPRPRWDYDVRAHPKYPGIRRRVWDLLRSQIRDDADDTTTPGN